MLVELRYATPNRLRYRFKSQLTVREASFLEQSFYYEFPQYSFRISSGNFGCVICADEHDSLDPNGLVQWLEAFLSSTPVHGPEKPPTQLELFKEQLRLKSINGFIALAVLGWVLPVLPGTPFFLMAWWLGWRPPTSDQRETEIQPS